MSDWKEYSIEDVAEILSSGGDAAKYPCKKSPEDGFGIPVYANSLENEGLYGYTNVAEINDDAVCIAARGAGTGHVYYHKGPFVPIVRLITLVPKREIADTRFLYYYLSGKKISGDGSAIPQITLPMVKKMEISLPSLSIQKRISSILSTLDYKIECNRRINENLEKQTQALFKSWFVDFEPFKDQPFVESELGMIPQGWKVLSFKEFIKPVSDKVPVGSLPEYSVTNTGIIPREAKFKKKLSSESSKNKILRRDNLVFGMSREILNWGIMEDEIGGVSSAYNIYEIEKEMVTPTYLKLYMTAKISDFNSLIGTAAREGQSLDKGSLMQKLVYIPPKDLEESFWEKYNSMISIINKNLDESRRLVELRDTLLPKLMSGEININ